MQGPADFFLKCSPFIRMLCAIISWLRLFPWLFSNCQITISLLNLDLTFLIFIESLRSGNSNPWSDISSVLKQLSVRCLPPSVTLPPTNSLRNTLDLLTTALTQSSPSMAKIVLIEDATLLPCLVARVILKFTELAFICSNEKLGSWGAGELGLLPSWWLGSRGRGRAGFCFILLFSSRDHHYCTQLNCHPHYS